MAFWTNTDSDKLIAIDVDGVVCDLLGGFIERTNFLLDEDILSKDMFRYHNVEDVQDDLHRQGATGLDIVNDFQSFMQLPDVYGKFVPLEDRAIKTIRELMEFSSIVFLTAEMTTALDATVSKKRLLNKIFPRIPIVVCPAKLKHRFRCDLIIEDRFDTIDRFRKVGIPGILIERPWSEIPNEARDPHWTSFLTKETGLPDVSLVGSLKNIAERARFHLFDEERT
jgi:5'(3')-deoxyribonucleotidase